MEEESGLYSWHEQFYYFTLFRALNGPDATPGKDSNTPIDDDTYYTQADLSAWIREQNHSRKRFLDGKDSNISANQIKVLDKSNFPWIRDSSERWEGHFQELVAYKEQHGHCNVPRRSGKLGVWVKNQRAAYLKFNDIANGNVMNTDVKKTTAVITQDQIKALTDLGLQWKIRESHSDAWEKNFEKMKAFKEEHGHCYPSTKEGPAVMRWACEMRARYKEKMAEGSQKNRISDEQIARLEEIGFVWNKKERIAERVTNSEEKQSQLEETKKKKNEARKRKRQEMKLQKEAEKKKAQNDSTVAALNTLINSKKSPVKVAAKAPNANPVADLLKDNLQKKLSSLKEIEKERVKNMSSSEEIEKSVDQIQDNIDKKLAAGFND